MRSVREQQRIPFFLLLVPVALAILCSLALTGHEADFILWWVTLLLFGLAAYPLTCFLFRRLTNRGYSFSKVLGILLVALVIWNASHAFPLFSQLYLLIALLVLGAISWGLPATRKAALETGLSVPCMRHIAFEESLFVLALFVWCLYKGMFPNINGEEKIMNFAFINALIRTDALPAPDPWLSGATINYYYFGHFVHAMIAKLSGVKSGVAYTLGLCTSFAMTLTMAFGLMTAFLDSVSRKISLPPVFRYSGGLLAGLAVAVFGNAHAFFYDEGSVGNFFVRFLGKRGVEVGQSDFFFYPNSTRFIGHNPNQLLYHTETGKEFYDYTIHEFPCYSYILGDLHAHVISLMIVMLLLAVFFALYLDMRNRRLDDRALGATASLSKMIKGGLVHLLRDFRHPAFILSGLLLGLAMMCNYWDYLIYLVVSGMVLFITFTLRSDRFSSLSGAVLFFTHLVSLLYIFMLFASRPLLHIGLQMLVFLIALTATILFPCALTRVSSGLSGLFVISQLSALPFNLSFDMISTSVSRTLTHTRPYQFLILWGVHLLFALLIIVIMLITRPHATERLPGRVQYFFAKKDPADLFVAGLAIVSLLLLAAPEFFFVRDIYGDNYMRTNTMFKFTYAAFILLALIMVYTFIRIIAIRRRQTYQTVIWSIAVALLAIAISMTAHYPFASIPQRVSSLSYDTYKTLDGTAYLDNYLSPHIVSNDMRMAPYGAAINWLNDHVKGTPTILEAYGDSYTDGNIVSAYTGLPTVFGWQGHQWLWRSKGVADDDDSYNVWPDLIAPRHMAIAEMYTSDDPESVRDLLSLFDVKYIIVGGLERSLFPEINEQLLRAMGDEVFREDPVYIIRVTDTSDENSDERKIADG